MSTIDQVQFVEDDIGAIINATIIDPATDAALDISGATTMEFRIKKPDATAATWTAAFTNSGTDGKIDYTTIADDLDQTGVYLLEARIVASGQDSRTVTQVQFRVRGKL